MFWSGLLVFGGYDDDDAVSGGCECGSSLVDLACGVVDGRFGNHATDDESADTDTDLLEQSRVLWRTRLDSIAYDGASTQRHDKLCCCLSNIKRVWHVVPF